MTGPESGRPAVPTAVRAVVPAYFHPAGHAEAWASLAECAARVRLVVLNLANGPGPHPDDAFGPALALLRARGVPVAGYVDTDYGRRPAGAALADLGRYLDWYGVGGVFFDRASAAAADLRHYAALAERARALGAAVVAFNHGAHPVEAYADHADLVGTFEGPWSAYLGAGVPRWVRARPAERFFHLVYSVPAGRLADGYALAARRHAAGAYVTDRGGANPWDRLPAGGVG